MALNVGNLPVKQVYVGSTPVTAVYVGSTLVWQAVKEVIQITLGTLFQARDQFRAALTERGMDYQTVTEIPFDIELVGTGSVRGMFLNCSSLTTVPEMDTSNVTNMYEMFRSCSSLTTVPEMDTSNVKNMWGMFLDCSSLTAVPDMYTSQVTNMAYMFSNCSALTSAPAMDTSSVTDMSYMFRSCSSLTSVPDMDTAQVIYMSSMFRNCAALTDGNVRLIGRHPQVSTSAMILDSGLTREPWYTAGGRPIEVHEVTLTDVRGGGVLHPLLTVTVPAGETWNVRIQGTVTRASGTVSAQPQVRIGAATFGPYGQGAAVDCSGTVTSADNTIAILTRSGTSTSYVSFVGTVTIEQVVQITPGFGFAAQNQLRAALSARGLDYQTVKGIPFGIEVVGSGSMSQMFFGCASLVSVPAMDTSGVTDMNAMFYNCSSLTYVPDMDTSQVTDMASMFRNCAALTDGNVRLIGRNPNVYTASMITGSGLTRRPFYDTAGNPI